MIWTATGVAGLTLSLTALSVATVWNSLDLSVFQSVDPAAWDDLLDGIRDGYVVLDDRGQITEANETARAMLGLSGDAADTDLAAQLPGVGDVLADLDAGEQVSDDLSPGPGVAADWLAVRAVSLPDGGDDRSVLVTLSDVSEQRQLERRYQALIETETDIVVILDDDGTITYASPSFEPVLGLDPSTLEGNNVLDDVHPEAQDALEAAFEELVATPGSKHRFEYSVTDAEGDWHVFEGIGRNLLADEVVEGIVVASRDITDRKRREEELRRQNEQLERFASVVSHDLRNPLQVAQGNVEHLEQTIEEDTRLQAVARSLDRMEALIDDVLELARQGKSVGETTPVSVESVARDAWAGVETGDRTLTVTGDVTLQADRTRLLRLFENLYRNAVEHAGTDVTVTVGPIEPMYTGTRAANDQPTGFYVADDGDGIPSDRQDEVLDAGTTTDDGGTGLGLAIVEQIADAHGWTVAVTDSRTGGARFEVTDRADSPLRPG